MEIGTLPPSLERLYEAQRAAQSKMRAVGKASRPSEGLLSAYGRGPAPAAAPTAASPAPVPQKHLGNFFDRIV